MAQQLYICLCICLEQRLAGNIYHMVLARPADLPCHGYIMPQKAEGGTATLCCKVLTAPSILHFMCFHVPAGVVLKHQLTISITQAPEGADNHPAY